MIQKNEDVCERHWLKLQWVLTPFSDSPGESVGTPQGKSKQIEKGPSAKRDSDGEANKWTRRVSLSKGHNAHPEMTAKRQPQFQLYKRSKDGLP